MPRYDYVCQNCGILEDEIQSIHDDAYAVCPKCGGKEIKRLICPPMVEVPVDYYDEHLEAHITSWAQRRDLMKAKGFKDGRGEDDRRIIQQKKMQADKLGISVKELNRRYDAQRIKI